MAARKRARSRQSARGKVRPGRAQRRKAARPRPAAKSAKKARKPVQARRKPVQARRKAAKPARPDKRQKPAAKPAVSRAAKPKPTAAKPKPAAAARPSVKTRTTADRSPMLNRERRQLPDAERLDPARVLADERLIASARAGHGELKAALSKHTAASPVLTAGDLDAKWEDAYSVGDEAPGGDNPTPDQDRVDDIGRALGINYQDDQELQGGDEVAERDRHRWELDPASSEDWPHDEDKD